MQPIFDTLFPHVQKYLNKAYGKSYILMYENLTRLATILYLKNQEKLSVSYVSNEEQIGFPWMYYLFSFCYNNFSENRNIYPDFESFIPEDILFMKGIARQIEEILFEYENKFPRVVSIFPMNGSTVSSQIKEVRITFNVPMYSIAFDSLKFNSENRKNFTQRSGEFSFSPNRKTVTIPVDLKENTQYGCTLLKFFDSMENYRMKEEYEWKFDTK